MLHAKNLHHGRYPLRELAASWPALRAHLRPHPVEGETVDFSDARAVLCLNQALLAHYYGIRHFELPLGALTPPIPGRLDYLCYLRDLIGPLGAPLVLDIGHGANAIFCLLGATHFGWRMVGSEGHGPSLSWAQSLVNKNGLAGRIELRPQPKLEQIFAGIIRPGEYFAATLCNPPFYASAREALAESGRKWKHLGLDRRASERNFRGEAHELWCPGGELGFLSRMIKQSVAFQGQVGWFTSLVSQGGHAKVLQKIALQHRVSDWRVIEMQQGQKKSRLIAWTFVTKGADNRASK